MMTKNSLCLSSKMFERIISPTPNLGFLSHQLQVNKGDMECRKEKAIEWHPGCV